MSFDLDNFNSVSRSTTAPKPVMYTYVSEDETLATIAASAYFNDVCDIVDENDLIYVVGSDGTGFYRVTSAQFAKPVTVTAFDTTPAGSIVNADISASAAIAFSKLATLTSANILVGSAGNVATSVAMSGDATISNTGALTIAATAVTPAKMTNAANYKVVSFPVSFETGEQATHTLYFPMAVTVTGVRSFVTTALANTDAGTITCSNNAGSAMAGGVITIPLSSAVATENTATPTTNNTFTAGQKMQLAVAKTTAGGRANVFVEYYTTG